MVLSPMEVAKFGIVANVAMDPMVFGRLVARPAATIGVMAA